MRRSRLLAVLLLFALIVPLAGATGPRYAPSTAAQEMPYLGEPPVFTSDTVLLQDTGQFRSAAGALTVDTSNREATRAFFNQYYLNAPTPDIGWAGNVDACQAGATSQAFKDAVSLRINFFRAMAGVWAGTGLSSVANSKDQQAALMFSANGSLSHNPPKSWKCYTADGAAAAGSSNIFLGEYGWEAVDGYMWDFGGSNAAAGHRANLLYPQTQLFGTGDIPGPFSQRWPANALWVFDSHVWDPRPATRDDFVAWPPKGYVPYQIVYPRWSFNYPGAGFTNATVTMKLNGTSVPVTVDYRSAALGAGAMSVPENTIVWRPNNLDSSATWPKPTSGDQTYTVTLSNVTVNGQARTFTYTVTVFDPATTGGSTGGTVTTSLSPTRGIPRSTVTASVSGSGKNVSVPVTWGNTLLTTITTNSSGSGSSTFKVPYAPMGSYPVTFSTGGGTVTKTFEVVPRIKLTPSTGAPGDTVDVSLRGYKARETVRIRWKRGSSWEDVARVTTSSTGSANINVKVPSWAPTGANSVRGDSTTTGGGRAQTNAFTVVVTSRIQAGTMSLSANRGTVNSRLTATLDGFPANTAVTLTFPGYYDATATGTTDATGAATLELRVPATPLGSYTVTVRGGDTQASGSYDVVPRIKLTPGEGARGSSVSVSLRGYGARETVRIRWQHGSSWDEVARVTTSSSGSANVDIPVPGWAVDGAASVRGDALSTDGGRAQTNAFVVSGGDLTSAAAATPTPPAEPAVNTNTSQVWAPFADGFESGTLDQWADVSGVSVQAGDARDGAYAALVASNGAPATARAVLSVPQPELYAHAAFKPVAQGANPVRLLQLRTPDGTPVVAASLDPESRLVITNARTGRQATGPAVTPGEWHDLQLHVRTGDGGLIEVWLDGQRIADLSSPDTLGGDPLASLVIGDDATGQSFAVLFDTIAVDLQCIGACPANNEPTPEVTPNLEPSTTNEPATEPTATPEPTEETITPTPEPTTAPEPPVEEPTATPTPSEESNQPPANEPAGEPSPPADQENQG
ncbi:MAG TPA: hypothetical protein VFL82_06555 [Thermomicrobiales bacterium]|nr:hypothetical protein [Thermomicrobiales bacterium]